MNQVLTIPTNLKTEMENKSEIISTDFQRNVVSLMGIPIDIVSLEDTRLAVLRNRDLRKKLLISTPNLNFFFLSRKHPQFYDALIKSNLVVADGVGLILIARFLGLISVEKVSGSDLFELLSSSESDEKLKVFLFGGDKNVAKEATKKLNEGSTGVKSVGFIDPGYGSAEDLSQESFIDEMNASNADMLMVSLGAQKGQSWILRNIDAISIPTISHLGAVINFSAKRIKRAPKFWQRLGLEWLWRIKEEPRLFSRYFYDGFALLKLIIFEILPYRFLTLRMRRSNLKRIARNMDSGIHFLDTVDALGGVHVKITGFLGYQNIEWIREKFSSLARVKKVNLDFSAVDGIDEFGTGQLLLLKKYLCENLSISSPRHSVAKVLRYERLESHITLNK